MISEDQVCYDSGGKPPTATLLKNYFNIAFANHMEKLDLREEDIYAGTLTV
jgi:hypothetical protein